MTGTLSLDNRQGVASSADVIRSGWSEPERRRRAEHAGRKSLQLFMLLVAAANSARASNVAALSADEANDDEPTILAVGAPCLEDLERVAG